MISHVEWFTLRLVHTEALVERFEIIMCCFVNSFSHGPIYFVEVQVFQGSRGVWVTVVLPDYFPGFPHVLEGP